MTAVAHRRTFLRGLATLPLVGGAVELIGCPRAVAMPVTYGLMVEYSDWLVWERHRVIEELYPEMTVLERRRQEDVYSLVSNAHRWHFGQAGQADRPDCSPPASTRAALVLSAVGCDWRGPYR